MRKRKYTMSEKRKRRDIAQVNWAKTMLIVRLKTEGKPVREIASDLGITDKRVYQILKRANEIIPE